MQPVMGLIMVLPTAMDWIHRDIPLNQHVERLGMWLMLYAAVALAIGVRAGPARA